MRHPELIYRIDRALQEAGLPRLGLDDFQRAEHQTILRLVQESLGQDDAEPLDFVLNRLPLDLAEVADSLLVRTANMDPNEDRVLEDLLRAILDLRRRNLIQNIDYLRYLMEDAQQQGDLRASEYGQAMRQNLQVRERLDRALGRYTSHSALPSDKKLPRAA